MAHHSQEVDEMLAGILREKFGPPEDLGATGEFPDGKVSDCDEGEIKYAVGGDKERGLVHLDFGKPVRWLAMTAKQAADLGQSLCEKARYVD